MNRILSCVAMCMLLASVSCKKETSNIQLPNKTATYNGRILAARCGQIVVQTFGDNRFGKINWNNGTTTYDYVFTAANHCQLDGLEENSSFQFKIIDDTPQTCVVCLAMIPTPDLRYSIQIVGK